MAGNYCNRGGPVNGLAIGAFRCQIWRATKNPLQRKESSDEVEQAPQPAVIYWAAPSEWAALSFCPDDSEAPK